MHKDELDQKEIVFIRVHGHVASWGKETADGATKDALNKEPTDEPMPFSDLKPLTAKYIHQSWQKEWDPRHFMRFYKSFQTNYYHFVKQGEKTHF